MPGTLDEITIRRRKSTQKRLAKRAYKLLQRKKHGRKYVKAGWRPSTKRKQAVKRLKARGFYKKIAALRSSQDLQATLTEKTLSHLPAYVHLVMEQAVQNKRDDPKADVRAFTEMFLKRDPIYSNTPQGLAALAFEALLLEKGGKLSAALMETVVESGEADFLAIFDCKVEEQDMLSLAEDLVGIAKTQLVVNQGELDMEEGVISDVAVLSGTPAKSKAPAAQVVQQAQDKADSKEPEPTPNSQESYEEARKEGGISEGARKVLYPQVVVEAQGEIKTFQDPHGVRWYQDPRGQWLPEANPSPKGTVSLQECDPEETGPAPTLYHTAADSLRSCFDTWVIQRDGQDDGKVLMALKGRPYQLPVKLEEAKELLDKIADYYPDQPEEFDLMVEAYFEEMIEDQGVTLCNESAKEPQLKPLQEATSGTEKSEARDRQIKAKARMRLAAIGRGSPKRINGAAPAHEDQPGTTTLHEVALDPKEKKLAAVMKARGYTYIIVLKPEDGAPIYVRDRRGVVTAMREFAGARAIPLDKVVAEEPASDKAPTVLPKPEESEENRPSCGGNYQCVCPNEKCGFTFDLEEMKGGRKCPRCGTAIPKSMSEGTDEAYGKYKDKEDYYRKAGENVGAVVLRQSGDNAKDIEAALRKAAESVGIEAGKFTVHKASRTERGAEIPGYFELELPEKLGRQGAKRDALQKAITAAFPKREAGVSMTIKGPNEGTDEAKGNYHCKACGWTGTADATFKNKCPKCGEQVQHVKGTPESTDEGQQADALKGAKDALDAAKAALAAARPEEKEKLQALLKRRQANYDQIKRREESTDEATMLAADIKVKGETYKKGHTVKVLQDAGERLKVEIEPGVVTHVLKKEVTKFTPKGPKDESVTESVAALPAFKAAMDNASVPDADRAGLAMALEALARKWEQDPYYQEVRVRKEPQAYVVTGRLNGIDYSTRVARAGGASESQIVMKAADRWWTGDNWSRKESAAKRYASLEEAQPEAAGIAADRCKGLFTEGQLPEIEFVAVKEEGSPRPFDQDGDTVSPTDEAYTGKEKVEYTSKTGAIVYRRNTAGMKGEQDPFGVVVLKGKKVVKDLGSHPTLDGAKKLADRAGEVGESLDEESTYTIVVLQGKKAVDQFTGVPRWELKDSFKMLRAQYPEATLSVENADGKVIQVVKPDESVEEATCPGHMENGPGKKYVRCDTCGRVDYEKNEGDRCGAESGGSKVRSKKNEDTDEARGEGQGVGGSRQGDGGASACVCPECGHRIPHERGTPCRGSACPKCGAAMVGESEDTDRPFARG